MLTNLTIQNLGCFDEYPYSIDFKKLTVLVGVNNSGKSMFLSGYNLMRVFSFRGLEWNNVYYQLQNNEQAVYSHDRKRPIEIVSTHVVGSDNYESKLSIQNDRFRVDEFRKNGTLIGSLRTNEPQELARSTWYFHPERHRIPFASQIGDQTIISGIQPILPNGLNVTEYLFQRFNDRDPRYFEVEKWLRAIDPNITILKTPIAANFTSMVTGRDDTKTTTDVNITLQGSGINNAATIITGIFFSPENATIIIEEPENFLNLKSIERLVDLFNYAVNNLSKQIIITTHSWYILGEYALDLCKKGIPEKPRSPKRTKEHPPIRPDDFKLVEFGYELGKNKIQEYDLKTKDYENEVIPKFDHL